MIRAVAIVVVVCLGCGSAPAARADVVGPPLLARDDAGRALTKAEIVELQLRLNSLGMAVGKPDGAAGRRTVAALRTFAARAGSAPTLTLAALIALRNATAVDVGLKPLVKCEEGVFWPANFYEAPQGHRMWGVPLDKAVVERERERAEWYEVVCLDGTRAEKALHYDAGKLIEVWTFSYVDGRPTPSQIQKTDKDGKVVLTYEIGRTSAGALTYVKPYGADGTSSRTVVTLPTKAGAQWVFVAANGAMLITYDCAYGDNGLMSQLETTAFQANGDKVVYHHFYDPKTSIRTRGDKYVGGDKIHDTFFELDAFGRIATETLRMTKHADAKYNKRWFELGVLTKDISEDWSGNLERHEFTNESGVYVSSRYFRNDRLVGEFNVVRDGAEIVETRLSLPDGRLFVVYPGRTVRYVDQRGRPKNGGTYRKLIDGSLW